MTWMNDWLNILVHTGTTESTQILGSKWYNVIFTYLFMHYQTIEKYDDI